MMLRVQRERMGAAYFPSAREYSRRYGLDVRRAARAAGPRDRHAPRADGPRHGDRVRGGRRAALDDRRPGRQRRSACGWPCSTCCWAAPSRRSGQRRHDGGERMSADDGAAEGRPPVRRGRRRRRAAGRRPDRRGRRRAERRRQRAVDGAGGVLLPGLVDLHTHLREPGREDAETVETGTLAAALGGFTAVHAMANTDPVADTAGVVEQVWRLGQEAGHCDVFPVGAVTVGPRRRADGRARHDGRLRRPGPGLLRRRPVRQRRRAHAPGAGVRQGLRRRRRPARPGAAAHRRRADERGRRQLARSASPAGPRSPRRPSSPATACSPATSAAGCTSATSPPPAASS